MITNYESFVNAPNFLELDKGGIQAKLSMNEFSSSFGEYLFESENDKLLLESAYGTYELGLLYENRKSWFKDETPIYMLEGDGHKILFKENSMFILSNGSYAILNEEDVWSDLVNRVNSGIKRVNDKAKEAINSVASASKETWDALSTGAKKVYEFGKKIVSAAVEFVKSDPMEAMSIFLKIISILLSFFPPVGLWFSPIFLAASGVLDIIDGVGKLRDSYSELKLMKVGNPKRSAEAFAIGGPTLMSGLISITFGLNDIITAPLAGVGSGPVSMAGKKAAASWGKSYVGKALIGMEGFIEGTLVKAGSKFGPKLGPHVSKFLGEKIAPEIPALFTIYLISVGKHIFGSMWNAIVNGLSKITDVFSFVLGLPTKIGNAIKEFKKSSESSDSSYASKIISSALDSFVGPAMRMVGSLLDTKLKPYVDGLSGWFKACSVDYKEIEKIADSKAPSSEKIQVETRKIKPSALELQKKNAADAKNLKKLPPVTAKTLKLKEGLNHIKGFEGFSPV